MLPEAVFTGFLSGEGLATSYASADLFFFPSDTETFGNVTLEAMASGLPCVVADATGSKSLVEHGINGFIAPADRPGLFEQHLTHLIEDKETRSRMSHESVKKAQGFAWETINNRLLEDYNELINHGRKKIEDIIYISAPHGEGSASGKCGWHAKCQPAAGECS